MEQFRFYGVNKPKKNEIVSIIITDRFDSHVEAYLIYYDVTAVMSYRRATTKKRIRSINKITPLNKLLPAIVDNVIEINNKLQIDLNRAYIDEEDESYLEYLNEQNTNKKVKSMIFNLSIKFKLNLNQYWCDKIHLIDLKRREEGCEYTLYDYIKYNLEKFKNLFEKEHYTMIKHLIEEYEKEKTTTLISEFGIVSPSGVDTTKRLIKQALEKVDNKIVVKSVGSPYFTAESSSSNSTVKEHQLFLEFLKQEIIKNKPPSHLKIRTTCY